jgi:hypothetical protein
VDEDGDDAVGPLAADTAAFISKCWRIPGFSPNKVGANGASMPGGDGFINPLMWGSLKGVPANGANPSFRNMYSQCGRYAGSIHGACWNSPKGPNIPGKILDLG